MTYQLSAKNNVPALKIENLDIIRVIGIDWNWRTLPQISDSSIRNFFEKLQQAICAVEIPREEEMDNEYEQDIAAQNNVLRIEISVSTASVDWDESLWLYIYKHIGLWRSYIHDMIGFYTDISNIAQMDDGLSKILSIIRGASNPVAEIIETFAVAPSTAKEILEMRLQELHLLSSLRSCSTQLTYWTEIEEIFNNLLNL